MWTFIPLEHDRIVFNGKSMTIAELAEALLIARETDKLLRSNIAEYQQRCAVADKRIAELEAALAAARASDIGATR